MNRRGLTGVSFFLISLPVALPVMADTGAEPPGYTYSQDWAVVSAPPPPGPYGAVNLDPRIPGQDMLPLLPVVEQASAVAREIPMADIPAEALGNPPAAGMPVMTETEDSPAAGLNAREVVLPPPVPGHYNRMMPAYNYPAPPRYPVRTGYPGYRNMPPMGYYGAPVHQSSQQVPPPPVYDAMMKNRQSYGNRGREGTP
jgi:hypothetical protein